MLTGSTLGGIADAYTYDTFGEVTAYTATSNGTPFLSLSYQRDALGRITSIGDRGCEYDPAGRLASITADLAVRTQKIWWGSSPNTSHGRISPS
jgi:uncharacterized protein RhaS with RHS repeats